MNEESKDPKKKRLKKRVVNETPREEDTAKVPAEQEVTEQDTKKRKSGHVKMIARKRPRPQPDDDSDNEYRKYLRIVPFDSTIDSEIMETKSFVSKLQRFHHQIGITLLSTELMGTSGHLEQSTRMGVERKYPLSKELLQQMLDLGLEIEEESTVAL
ncbi:hypothetical protein Tco_0841191 [Tanacetum coccineum]|uniref:Uncharacterized protein n=1 Tax=Tanacetum coccineum TaxID=301880 RepID=A0ABQ5B1B2_9ASTR